MAVAHAACSCNFGALKMGSNGQGFMYPILEQSKCKNCNSCYKVCPAVDDNLNKIRGAVKIGECIRQGMLILKSVEKVPRVGRFMPYQNMFFKIMDMFVVLYGIMILL